MLPANHVALRKALVLNVLRPYSIIGGSIRSIRSSSTSGNGKKKNDPLIPNAPGWDEKNATDSEADVKADHDPDDIDVIKKKTTEKFKDESNK